MPRTLHLVFAALVLTLSTALLLASQPMHAVDPGLRAGADLDGGGPLPGLTAGQTAAFNAGAEEFDHHHSASEGLGPRLQLNVCSGCHLAGGLGGTSPDVNPEIAFATELGAQNTIPSFLSLHGPAREARFLRNPDGSPDGGVHNLFTITGRDDAPGCHLQQPDFAKALREHNVIFRIATSVLGDGLVEAVPDATLLEYAQTDLRTVDGRRRHDFGIHGHAARAPFGGDANRGGTGTVSRFGWKAQNESMVKFVGEAYNVELGVSNDLFPGERDEDPHCQFASVPNDTMHMDDADPLEMISDMEKLAMFMRFSALPTPAHDTAAILHGRDLFTEVGCATCHRPTLTTGTSPVAALDHQTFSAYSDFLVHDMGALGDGVSQGSAGPTEFRTAPLAGMGSRRFLLHDGRTTDLVQAIAAHGMRGSEAAAVVNRFNWLSVADQNAVLLFVRSR